MVAAAVIDRSPHESVESAAVPRHRQVTLLGLFICTTYFAISSALATRFGLGIFVLMNGVFLTWLGFRGYLWWMQTARARPKAYLIAWLLFAVSFGLPALSLQGCGTAPSKTQYGWQAAAMTAILSVETVKDSATIVRDPTQRTAKNVGELMRNSFLVVLLNLPNLLMLISPYLLYRQQREKGRVLSLLFSCAALSSWSWGIVGGADLRIGYYVWSSGITAIALARRPGWRSLAALGALGALWLVLELMYQ